MKFIDLAAQQGRIRQDIETRIHRVLDHGQYVNGPEVAELEDALAEYTGTAHAVGCSSGTDALLMALMALEIGPGDAVITTPFTFIATAEVIRLLGATPVFVDVDPATFNIDPEKLKTLLSAFGSGDADKHPLPVPCGASQNEKLAWVADTCPLSPKALITVDLFGLASDYEVIRQICREHGLILIEDAAQSFGATYQGARAGALADVGCTSFFPAKPLGCYGDGGMCFTDDDETARLLRSVRNHGQGSDKYDNVRVGINGRLDTMQSAILLSKFSLFPEEVTLRQTVAERYTRAFEKDGRFTPQAIPQGSASVFAQYSLLAADRQARDQTMARAKTREVPTVVYYPLPLHLQTAFSDLGYKKGDFPVSEDLSHRIFALPMHPYLSEADQDRVIEAILGD